MADQGNGLAEDQDQQKKEMVSRIKYSSISSTKDHDRQMEELVSCSDSSSMSQETDLEHPRKPRNGQPQKYQHKDEMVGCNKHSNASHTEENDQQKQMLLCAAIHFPGLKTSNILVTTLQMK